MGAGQSKYSVERFKKRCGFIGLVHRFPSKRKAESCRKKISLDILPSHSVDQ